MELEHKHATQEALLEEILAQLKNQNRDSRLWTVSDIAEYTQFSKKTVQNNIISKVSFPPPLRFTIGQGKGSPRWYPTEVKEWVNKNRIVISR